jgi:hypothetical protein
MTLKQSRGNLLLVVAIGLSVIFGGAAVLTPKGTGAKWYAPKTWFSHRAADKVDAAAKKDDAAAAKVDAKTDEVIHAATREAHKTNLAAAQLPPSLPAATVQRTAANTFDLLTQVSPLPAAEAAADEAILRGLLSSEQAKREAAEIAQAAAEKKNGQLSTELAKVTAEKAATAKALDEKQDKLRQAYDRENSLANELRAETARKWILISVCVLLLAAGIYFRSVAGSVGKALHVIEPIIGTEKYHAVVSQIDTELGALGQWAVRTGKVAAAAAEAKARAVLSGKPALTAPATPAPAVSPSTPSTQSPSPASQ